MKGLPSWFIPLWCTVMPLTSFLLIPSIQGTIPAYVFGLASAGFVVLSRDESGKQNIQRTRYIVIALAVAGIWLLLLCGSQLGHLVSNRRDFGDLFLIEPQDTRVVLRKTIFTQTLYLSACVCIALFFRFFFRPEWMRYVFWGAWFLAIYGIYEWLFFLIFKQSGDFFVNRTYGTGHTASWSQPIALGPLTLLRIKSTFGEPSFFSAGVLPYLFLAVEHKRKWLSSALFFCVVFSTSSSAFAGLVFALMIHCLFQRRVSLSIAMLILLFVGVLAALYFVFPDTYDAMFTAKLNRENQSGELHQAAHAALQDELKTFTVMNHLFGIGFGYFYGSVFSAVLINTGWIGLMVYCFAFLQPALLLRPENGGLAFKVAIATLFFLYFVNVSELFLPTTWMFLGLAYWQLDRQRSESRQTAFAMRRATVLAETT